MAHAQPHSPNTKPGNNWREKYLELVEQYDSQQQTFERQLEQLRRALVRVSLAADGADPELDQVLAALREHLKSPEKHNQLHRRLAVVEEAILAFDERKLSRLTRLQQAVESLLAQLRHINTERGLNKALKELASDLPVRLGNAQELPEVLRELSTLQAKILQAEDGERTGFLQKWLPGRDKPGTAPKSTPQKSPPPAVEDASAEPADTDLSVITAEMSSILALVEAGGGDKHQVKFLQQQLQSDISLERLQEFLRQLRHLINDAVTQAKKEFGEFLYQTNSQLQDISQILNHASRLANHENDRQREFYRAMGDQLQSLQSTVTEAGDLEKLKREVSTQLAVIRENVTQADKQPHSLSAQLKDLLNKVETFEREAQTASKVLSQQKQKAQTDSLTGLPNREAYLHRLNIEVARWQRYNNSLTLAILDIDHFKQINDNFGHQAGDRVLQLIAQALRKNLRETDFIGRYGGEEFVAILPETDAAGAEVVLNKLRDSVAGTPFHFRKQPVQITLSIGYSEFHGADSDKVVFERADKALYQAKNQGRNTCRLG